MSVLRNTLTANGPASAATDPDHGSAQPLEKAEMNSSTDTTAAAPAASDRNWFEMAQRFESALYTIRDLSRLAHVIAVQNFDEIEGEQPTFRIPCQNGEEIISLTKAAEHFAASALGATR